MADIFVSYARADKARVAPLVAALEAQGWTVWWDPEITPGQEFDSLIRSEIGTARAVIVVWTPASVDSRWVRGEARLGAERGILVPVRFDNAQLPIDALSLHTTDLDDWKDDQRSRPFQNLARAIARLLGQPHEAPAPAAIVQAKLQQIRYCKAKDGARIAYASSGKGPPIVKTANWMTHLEYDWEYPMFRHWHEALMQHHRLIRFDERGCGLSDANPPEISLDTFVSDLEAVADAAGAERFALFAISQGSAVAIDYAARHPERVACLILVGGFANGQLHRDDPGAIKQLHAFRSLVEIGWGNANPAFRQTFTSLMYPDAKPDEATSFNDIQRRSSTPENAVKIVDATANFDVRAQLAKVRCPTLVLHAVDDALVPFSLGREIAQGIDGARLISLDTQSHVPLASDHIWPRCAAEMASFLAEHWPGAFDG